VIRFHRELRFDIQSLTCDIPRMIPVTLLDIFADAQRGEAWMILADPTARRGLPIFIGSWSPSMVLGLRKNNPRPLTFEFVAKLLEAVGADLDAVHITEVKDRTFHAIARVRAGAQEVEVDARPSDAVPLAVRMNKPVYVADDLMERLGRPLDADMRPPEVPASFVSTRWTWADESGPQEP
jgi:uncharacterized protein